MSWHPHVAGIEDEGLTVLRAQAWSQPNAGALSGKVARAARMTISGAERSAAGEHAGVEQTADDCQQNSDEQSLIPSPNPCHLHTTSGKRRPVEWPRRKV